VAEVSGQHVTVDSVSPRASRRLIALGASATMFEWGTFRLWAVGGKAMSCEGPEKIRMIPCLFFVGSAMRCAMVKQK